jgi:hypothetical protein
VVRRACGACRFNISRSGTAPDGTAMAYGGNPEKDVYLNVTPSKNDGKTVHRLTINGEVSPSTASGRSLSTTTRAI